MSPGARPRGSAGEDSARGAADARSSRGRAGTLWAALSYVSLQQGNCFKAGMYGKPGLVISKEQGLSVMRA